MEFHNPGYMLKATESLWRDIIKNTPRKNLETILFDLTVRSGFLYGAQVQAQSSPNLTIKVTKGRAVYRDIATNRAKVMEVLADTTVDMTTYVPGGVTTTYIIALEPLLNTSAGVGIAVDNAPNTSESYDPAFTPYTLQELERDEAQIKIVSSLTGQQVAIGEVQLAVGQATITSASIFENQRFAASGAATITELEAKYTDLIGRVESLEAQMTELLGGQFTFTQEMFDWLRASQLGKQAAFSWSFYPTRDGITDIDPNEEIEIYANRFQVNAGERLVLMMLGMEINLANLEVIFRFAGSDLVIDTGKVLNFPGTGFNTKQIIHSISVGGTALSAPLQVFIKNTDASAQTFSASTSYHFYAVLRVESTL